MGLFTTGVPQQLPVACVVTPVPGITQLGPVPDGSYHPLAVCFDPGSTVIEALADHEAPVRYVGAATEPVTVAGGRCEAIFKVDLRRPGFTDAPVMFTSPLVVTTEPPV